MNLYRIKCVANYHKQLTESVDFFKRNDDRFIVLAKAKPKFGTIVETRKNTVKLTESDEQWLNSNVLDELQVQYEKNPQPTEKQREKAFQAWLDAQTEMTEGMRRLRDEMQEMRLEYKRNIAKKAEQLFLVHGRAPIHRSGGETYYPSYRYGSVFYFSMKKKREDD